MYLHIMRQDNNTCFYGSEKFIDSILRFNKSLYGSNHIKLNCIFD